jgi:hypothetical protein
MAKYRDLASASAVDAQPALAGHCGVKAAMAGLALGPQAG